MEGLIPLAYAGIILVLLGVFGGLGLFLGWLLSSPAEEEYAEQEVFHHHTHAFLPQVVELKHEYPQAEPVTCQGRLSEEEVQTIASNTKRVQNAMMELKEEKFRKVTGFDLGEKQSPAHRPSTRCKPGETANTLVESLE